VAKAIVFDLRGNDGGRSAWASQILESLFTKSYFDNRISELNKNVCVDWKASADNLQHLTDISVKFKSNFGEQSTEYLWACGSGFAAGDER
jgi:hypothetical protein